MTKTLTQIQTEAREELRLTLKKAHKWHDYQDHCHFCGESDAKKYPYCVPYELAEKSDSLISEAYQAGKDASVNVIEQAFSESRPKTELNISELFRQARSV